MKAKQSTSNAESPTIDFFVPHPNLSDEINHNICRSEIEGGVWLDELPVGVMLEVETKNRYYVLQHRGDGQALISGHPKFCPEPVLVDVHGSTWGRAMLKMRFVGRGMHLEFHHPIYGLILTSPIQEIREWPESPSMIESHSLAC